MNMILSRFSNRDDVLSSLVSSALGGTAVLLALFAFTNTAFAAQTLNQTITFGTLSDKTYGDPSFTLSASASSGLSVTFTSTSTSCHIYSSNHVSIDATGTCTIQASQAGTSSGNPKYNPAPNVYQSFNVAKKTITVSGITANKVYDGLTTVTPNASAANLLGKISGDSVSLNTAAATGTFGDKNVGTNKLVTISGLALTGSSSGNYSLVQPTTSANITPRPITVTASNNTKLYDGTTTAVAIPTVTTGSIVAGDTGTFIEKYSSKIAGVHTKTLNPAGSISDGNNGNNYAITFAPFTTGTINQLPISASVSVLNGGKVYDATTTATIDSRNLIGVLAGDDVTVSGGTATYNDKNVGTGKPVTVTGLTLGGADAANYTLGSTYSLDGTSPTTANITARPLTVTATGINKTYTGDTNASVTLATDAIAGDAVTAHGTTAFATPDKGTGIAVQVTGITIDGADASNYTLSNTTADTSANIVEASATLSLTDPTQLAATYDGTAKSVDFTVDPTRVPFSVTYNGTTTAPTDAGSYPVVAAITDPNYAGTASATLVIAKAPQTIDFAALSDKHYGDAPFEVSASSTLPVTFTTQGACSIDVGTTTVQITGKGTCAITAHQAGDDNHSAAADVTQSFGVTDVTAPVITLNGDAVVTIKTGATYTDAGATATDNFDGDITPSIVTVNPVDTSTVGDYTVTYNVKDSSNNAAAQVTRTVHVVAHTGTLVVKNVVDNTGGGTASSTDFSFSINGATSTAFNASGINTLTMATGTYAVTGVANASYTTTYAGCAAAVVAADATSTCTITNTYIVPAPATSSSGNNNGSNGPIAGSLGGGGGSFVAPYIVLPGSGPVAGAPTAPAPTGVVLGAEIYHFSKTLRKGNHGTDVTELQKFLAKAGYFKGDTTGYFGNVTVAAVKAYQKAHKLDAVGYVGPRTRDLLNAGTL